MANPTCGKCGGKMTQGFIPEARDSSWKITTWFAGPPIRSWLGLRLRGLARHEVTGWRCDKCGYLELYAPGN
jgi:ribosomal protein S27AE